MVYIIGLLVVGACAGVLSGLLGIGGAVVVIPALVYFFGFTEHKAQGTTLAMMIPPIGILAAYTYYKAGNVDIKAAAFLAVAFVVGALLGAKITKHLPDIWLAKGFGALLIVTGIRMLFFR